MWPLAAKIPSGMLPQRSRANVAHKRASRKKKEYERATVPVE